MTQRTASRRAAPSSQIERDRRRLVLPFLLLPTIIIVALFVVPLAQTVLMSGTDWYGTFQTSGWVGLANYEDLVGDRLFRNAVSNTFYYFILSLLLLFPSALFIAWGILRFNRGRSFFQVVIFAPAVLSVAVAGVLWRFIYNPNFGILNELLRAIGLESLTQAWLGNTQTAMPAVVITVVWHGIATWVILIVAGMDRIPKEVTEAASLDGATHWQAYVRVTLPLLWPVLSTLIVLWFIQAMQTFPFIYVMTQGGPHGATDVMGTYMYRMAFEGRMFAYGSAMAIVMVGIILVVSVIGVRLLRGDRFER